MLLLWCWKVLRNTRIERHCLLFNERSSCMYFSLHATQFSFEKCLNFKFLNWIFLKYFGKKFSQSFWIVIFPSSECKGKGKIWGEICCFFCWFREKKKKESWPPDSRDRLQMRLSVLGPVHDVSIDDDDVAAVDDDDLAATDAFLLPSPWVPAAMRRNRREEPGHFNNNSRGYRRHPMATSNYFRLEISNLNRLGLCSAEVNGAPVSRLMSRR